MLLKYTEDGHVVGVGSQLGHQITLSVQGGRMMVSLEGPNGTQETVTHTQQLERNVFTDVVSVWVHVCVYMCVSKRGSIHELVSIIVHHSPSPHNSTHMPSHPSFPSLSSFPSRLPLPPQSVSCEVSGDMLSCSVSVEGSSSLEMAQVPYSGTLFFPTLPIVFGRTINSSGSYVSISTHSQEHACCIIWTSGEDS